MNNNGKVLLIKSLSLGKENAYSLLVDEYHQKLFLYAYKLSNNYALSEDMVQNVFLKIWEQRKKLKINESLENYLYKIVYNDFVNYYKKRKSLSTLEEFYMKKVTDIIDEERNATLENKKSIVKREISKLPPKCKEVFLLSKREGLTNKEISEYLNISIKTVENQITKAFHILRRKAKEEIKGFFFFLLKKW